MKILKTIQNKGKKVKLYLWYQTYNVYMSFVDKHGNKIEHNDKTAESFAAKDKSKQILCNRRFKYHNSNS